MALKDIKVGRKENPLVDPLGLTIIPGWNEKEYTREQIEEMKASIRLDGVREAIRVLVPKKDKVFQTKFGEYLVKAGTPCVVHGHRRTTAAKELREEGLDLSVEIKLEDESISEAKLILSQDTDNSGIKLTPLQKGHVYRRSIALGNTEDAIAKEIGKSIQHVQGCLSLAYAPAAVQELIKNDEISATTVLRVLENSNSEKGALDILKMIADKTGEVMISAEAAIEALKRNDGDVRQTIDHLIEASEVAQDEGKKRVGKKHIEQVQSEELKGKFNKRVNSERKEEEEEENTVPLNLEAEVNDALTSNEEEEGQLTLEIPKKKMTPKKAFLTLINEASIKKVKADILIRLDEDIWYEILETMGIE